MKQWEIIKAAQEEGAKIRKAIWRQIKWVEWKDNKWRSDCGGYATVCMDENPLEIYVEPIRTFGPDRAMYWLERGLILKRKPWMKNLQISRRSNGFVTFRDGSDVIDWFHDDWHLCDSEGNYVPEPEEGK